VANLVLIISDLAFSGDALRRTLCSAFPDVEFKQVDGWAGVTSVRERSSKFDVLVIDLWLPSREDYERIRQLRLQWPDRPILVAAALVDHELLHAVQENGNSDVFLKSDGAAALADGVANLLFGTVKRRVEDCRTPHTGTTEASAFQNRLTSLTPHERLVLKNVCQGMLNKQIAYRLGIRETTVKAHIRSIFRKLRFNSRVQAVLEISEFNVDGFFEARRTAELLQLADDPNGADNSAQSRR